ncbi:hypothetical protein AX17_004070 [Amanita inopinata Kibby_2008]|nr:hypothetical protein AX17_004070 [Amanita inopinata Kibby_2008]
MTLSARLTSPQNERIYLIPAQSSNVGDDYEFLASLFEQLQLTAFEAADLTLDFLTFVNNVHYFAMVMKRATLAVAREATNFPTAQSSSSSSSSPRGRRGAVEMDEYQSKEVIGMIYLANPTGDPNIAPKSSELNLGIIIHSDYQKKGYATKAIQIALDHAFKMERCHRVQAAIINPFTPTKYPAYKLFTSIGFKKEGLRRQSYFSPFDGEWQDVAYLALLETEWALRRASYRTTPWDEMIARHEKEREMVLLWEERASSQNEEETIHQFPLDEMGGIDNNNNENTNDDGTENSVVTASLEESSRATSPSTDSEISEPEMPEKITQSTTEMDEPAGTAASTDWDLVDEFSDLSYDGSESDSEVF